MMNVRSRSGMTLTEVLLAMAIFLVGSVSLVGLFVTASALHADAMNRRRAAFIADELLAEVRALPFRDVFAKTNLAAAVAPADAAITVDAVRPDATYQGALFSSFPANYLLNPSTDPNNPIANNRDAVGGPLLLEGSGADAREWAWYTSAAGNTFTLYTPRGLWGTASGTHLAPARVLQPRSWRFVLETPLTNNAATLTVRGDPTVPNPATPPSGYIVVDEEWMPYTNCATGAGGTGTFNVRTNAAGVPQRGWGGTGPQAGLGVAHLAGTPVTVAREHPFYPGFYYTVQFYPADATGASAQVIITVGYGNDNLFRAHAFHTIYTPTSY